MKSQDKRKSALSIINTIYKPNHLTEHFLYLILMWTQWIFLAILSPLTSSQWILSIVIWSFIPRVKIFHIDKHFFFYNGVQIPHSYTLGIIWIMFSKNKFQWPHNYLVKYKAGYFGYGLNNGSLQQKQILFLLWICCPSAQPLSPFKKYF